VGKSEGGRRPAKAITGEPTSMTTYLVALRGGRGDLIRCASHQHGAEGRRRVELKSKERMDEKNGRVPAMNLFIGGMEEGIKSAVH